MKGQFTFQEKLHPTNITSSQLLKKFDNNIFEWQDRYIGSGNHKPDPLKRTIEDTIEELGVFLLVHITKLCILMLSIQ